MSNPLADTHQSLFRVVWREFSRSIIAMAALLALVLISSYLIILTLHKHKTLSEKSVLISRTLDLSFESSDWTLALEHLNASIRDGGLSRVSLTTIGKEKIAGPIESERLGLLPICSSRPISEGSTFVLEACLPLISTIEIITIASILLLLFLSILIVRAVFRLLAKNTIGQLATLVTSMRRALRGQSNKVAYLETQELAKEIENLVQEAKLSASDRTRSRLVAQIVHDIRSPVTALRVVKNHQSMRNNSDIGQLLDSAIGRIESLCAELVQQYKNPGLDSKNKSCSVESLHRLIVESITTLNATASAKNAKVTYGGSLLPARVPADALTVQRLVDNLVMNSLHAAPHEAGSVHVALNIDAKTNTLSISVADNGHGIAAEDLNRIFEQGYTKHSEDGSGLGLHFVKTTVEAYGGDVQVTSRVGVGTQFDLTLPVQLVVDREMDAHV